MKKLLIACVSIICQIYAETNTEKFFKFMGTHIGDAWENGDYALIVPFNIWHNRYLYDDEHIKRYNEIPYGAGFAKWMSAEKQLYGVYAIAFADSNYHTQTMFGYIHQYHLNDNALKFSLGYTLGFTQRHEYYYIPVPLPLPTFGISFKALAVQAAYVPGLYNNGNVLFSWVAWSF